MFLPTHLKLARVLETMLIDTILIHTLKCNEIMTHAWPRDASVPLY